MLGSGSIIKINFKANHFYEYPWVYYIIKLPMDAQHLLSINNLNAMLLIALSFDVSDITQSFKSCVYLLVEHKTHSGNGTSILRQAYSLKFL